MMGSKKSEREINMVHISDTIFFIVDIEKHRRRVLDEIVGKDMTTVLCREGRDVSCVYKEGQNDVERAKRGQRVSSQ